MLKDIFYIFVVLVFASTKKSNLNILAKISIALQNIETRTVSDDWKPP